jgi:hypothetical protein
MYLEILTLLAVISLALILAFYNRRQADALRGVERMVKDFLAIQIRDRRDKHLAKLEDLDATAWLEKLINARVSSEVKLLDVLRIIPEVFAAEIQAEDGRKIVVSTKAKAILKQYDKISRSRGNNAADRIASVAAKPILNKKFEVFEINMVEETEYFDVEAEFVGNALGMKWTSPTRLWIYVVG